MAGEQRGLGPREQGNVSDPNPRQRDCYHALRSLGILEIVNTDAQMKSNAIKSHRR